MAIAFVQATQSAASGNTQTPTGVLGNTTTGNLIICGVLPGGPVTVNGVADAANGAYAKAISQANTSWPLEIWYKSGITGATTPTVTVTLNTTENANVIELYEFSGIAASSPLDGAGLSATGSSTAVSTGPYTTTNANDLLFSINNTNSTVTAGTGGGWVLETTWHSGQYLIVSSATAYTATYTQTSNTTWTVGIVAFKASGGAAGYVYPASGNPVSSLATASSSVRRILTPVFKRF